MNIRLVLPRLCSCLLLSMSIAPSPAGAQPTPLNSLFTYQGILQSNGAPFTGTADFQFTLWDAPAGGTLSGTFIVPAASVSEGGISFPIDLGSADFNGTTRYLQIAVRTPPGSGAYTTLSPRQKITPTPYALFSVRTRGIWSTADGQNVGIGTIVPSARLEVRDGDFVLGTYNEQWYFHPRSSFGGDFLQITDNDAGVPQFQRGLVIHQNGNVGIGTTAPAKKLTVAGSMEIGTSAGDYQHLRIGGGNSSGFLYGSFAHFADGIHLGYNYYANSAGANQVIAPNGGTSRLSLGYGSAVIATAPPFSPEPVNRMVVTQDGDIGIGTVAPANRLHVIGTIEGEVGLFTGVRGTTTGTLGSGTSTGVTGIALSNSGGAVGVKGQSNSPAGYDFYAAGAGTNYGAESSRRWKRNIELIADPLAMLDQMRGVFFDWDAEHGGHHDVGMIAEEVGAVLPEIVQYEANGIDANGMDYSKVTPLLVEAVKSLRAEKDAQIRDLQDQVAQQRAMIDELRDHLQRLEGLLDPPARPGR